jgi:tetratricopeptide (TPR) repeat protein
MVLSASLLAGCGMFGKKPAGKGTRPARPSASTTAPAPDKGDPQARFNAAVQLMKERKLQEAEAAFVALSGDFPQYSGTMTNLGILYAKTNRRDQAIGALTKATALNGKNAVAWNWLGMVLREAGDNTSAERSYNKALSIKPDYALAHLNLGVLYDAHLGRPAEALGHYKEYQRLAGKDELRVAAWIAEIESKNIVSKPVTPAARAPASTSAPAAKPDSPKKSLFPVKK